MKPTEAEIIAVLKENVEILFQQVEFDGDMGYSPEVDEALRNTANLLGKYQGRSGTAIIEDLETESRKNAVEARKQMEEIMTPEFREELMRKFNRLKIV